ncbi:YhdP family phospholipid transporter [Marinobacter sp. F4206]|uniref:YhdP family phospholipid transporter n=1 Tax=Marinobacter sp. F4206 TaxID=2861777 RepID=UPI001C5DE874|nr:AsmA-like C-terminal region-containing protein [Marinobacter sp. F4206]MBW4933855.1 hypothetical protein [Marinobacter sp. F4206]
MSSADRESAVSDYQLESPPVRVAARVSSLVWWFLLLVLVVFALYAGLGRQLTRNVDAFADDLAVELSARLGQEVAIGSLSSQWFWLDPSFTAQQISVTNPDSGVTVARVDHLRVRFDFLSSLRRLRVVFEDFEVDGVELTLDQSDTGQVGVHGADLPEPVNNRLEHWLELAGDWLSEPYLKITRFSLGIRDNEGHQRHVYIPQLDLVYRQGLFRASGRAIKSGTTEQLASFSLVGRHFFRGDFTGQLYLDLNSGRLFDGLIDEYQWRGVRVEGFDVGGEAWLTFRDGEMLQVNGTLKTPYLQLGVGSESLAPIENIQARFGWRRSQDALSEGGSAQVDDSPSASGGPGEWHLQQLEWTWNGDKVSPFSLRLAPEQGGVTVIADALPLGPTRRLLSLLPILPSKGAEALKNYRPDGYLDRMSLWLPQSPGNSFELSGHLRDISIKAFRGVPGLSGLSGSLYLEPSAGYVEIGEGDLPVSLEFPKLYNGGWALSDIGGLVAWQLDGAITRVFSDNLHMAYGDRTKFSGAFDLKLNREGEDSLGLRVGVENANEAMLAEFVPSKVVNPELYRWLTTSIRAAEITSGVYYGHGQIGSDAPKGSFVSSMRFDFENASVVYDERWPEVSGAKGRVVVNDQETLVTLERGETGGLALSPSTVTILPDTDGTQVRVDVSAVVPGDAVGFWLSNSPLGDMAGSETAALEFGGSYQVELGLDLPLAGDREVVVEAHIRADDGSVAYPPAGLAWESLSGELTYHSVKGFSGGPLTASFFNEPVNISLARSGSGDALSIRQSGQLSMADALATAGLAPDTTLGLSGVLSYSAALNVGADSTSLITVRSDLQGVAVDWPDPLAKLAEEAAPLLATIDPGASGGIAVKGEWENRASFDVLWKETGLDMDIGHLHLGAHTLKDIQIEALDLGDRWVVGTRSERAVGRVVVPDDDTAVTADFEVMRLVRDDEAREEAPELLSIEEQIEAFRSLDMGDWPDVNVTISDLQLNQESLGRWAFQLRPEPYRLNVDGIEGRLNSLTLLGTVTWSIIDDREVSRFAGTITGGALADLNELFGADIPLTNKATNIKLDLGWPGRPDEILMADMSGSVSLRLDEGIILEQNNTAQLFRVFNLLNADTLWRRLKLDFSDLYERGVAFDAISGKAQLIDGLITMDPELQVVGPSGAFKLSGSTDIADETLDMRLVVVLPLTQNLPLAALLMGAGAPIGGALFVLDKILGDPLSKLTSASYGVTGTWDDPQVDLQRVFDTGE